MSDITIGYTDGSLYQLSFIKTVFYNIFPDDKCVFVKDPEDDPKYLIFSITGDNNEKYKKSYKILIKTKIANLENYKADLIIDCVNDQKHLPINTKTIYIPAYVISMYERFQNGPNNLIKPNSYNPEQILQNKTKFCAFLYNNCESKFRNKFYFMLSKYKQVDALGRCLGKTKGDRFVYKKDVESYHDSAVQKYKPYKFVICFESVRQNGYISEKIVNVMLANCIPIYSGSTNINEHFNDKSFINMNNYKEIEECIKYIEQVDKDDNLYLELLKQPWLNENKLSNWFSIGMFIQTIKDLIKSGKKEEKKLSRSKKTTKNKKNKINKNRSDSNDSNDSNDSENSDNIDEYNISRSNKNEYDYSFDDDKNEIHSLENINDNILDKLYDNESESHIVSNQTYSTEQSETDTTEQSETDTTDQSETESTDNSETESTEKSELVLSDNSSNNSDLQDTSELVLSDN
jgi:hypothetical protein